MSEAVVDPIEVFVSLSVIPEDKSYEAFVQALVDQRDKELGLVQPLAYMGGEPVLFQYRDRPLSKTELDDIPEILSDDIIHTLAEALSVCDWGSVHCEWDDELREFEIALTIGE